MINEAMNIANMARQLEEDLDFKRAEKQHQKECAIRDPLFRRIFGGKVGWVEVGTSNALGVVDVQAGLGPNPHVTLSPFVLDNALAKDVREALVKAGTIQVANSATISSMLQTLSDSPGSAAGVTRRIL